VRIDSAPEVDRRDCGWPLPQVNLRVAVRSLNRRAYWSNRRTPKLDGPLGARCYYREFEKVAPRVYLPRKIGIAVYNLSSAPQNMWNRVSFTKTMNVTKVSVGQHVEDGLFRFAFTPGTEVMNRITNRYYRIGNLGEELARWGSS
jgi:hypothetical protein